LISSFIRSNQLLL